MCKKSRTTEKSGSDATTKTSKTQVFNVIILDRSGSMTVIRRTAVSSFNETLAGIKKAQEKYADTQDHFVTLVTFCGCSTEYVFDKVPVKEARPLSMKDYVPCCRTPLYDAMGFTISGMRGHIKEIEDATVVVTIITDGLENASKEYSREAISSLVQSLRDEGWSFTYMGANQDAVEVSSRISIRNARDFDYSPAGMQEGMDKDWETRMNYYFALDEAKKSGRRLSKRMMSEMADACFDAVERRK